MEEKCEVIRVQYQAVATRGAVLHELVRDFSLLSPMYDYDLTQFVSLMKSTLLKCATTNKVCMM